MNCLGVPLSCRFFIRGEPPNKNAACGYPGSTLSTSILKLMQDVRLPLMELNIKQHTFCLPFKDPLRLPFQHIRDMVAIDGIISTRIQSTAIQESSTEQLK